VYTKVNKVYMKDIGWGNKEAKVKVTLSFNDVSAKAYEDTFTNNCNIITCTLLGGWHLITNGWELSQVFSINSIGDKSISVFAEDLYAGTSDSKNTQITVKEPPKPKPVLVSLDYQSEMPENGEETIIVKYRNDGGDSYEAYFSPSFDNNWEVKEYTGDLANKKLYPKDSEISTSKNTGTKPSDYPLIDFWGEWKSGQEKTFKIKLKPKSTGPIFFNLRVALCYFDVERKCIRDPTSGETDQQGWDVYRKTVKVNPVLHKLELSSNENSVMFSTNKGESCIAYGNSCEIELSSGDYTITAQKVAILASTGGWMLDPSNDWLPETKSIKLSSPSKEVFSLVKKLVLSAISDKAVVLTGETVTLTTTLKNIQNSGTKITVSLIDKGIIWDSTLWTETQDAQSENIFKIQVPLWAEKDVHKIRISATDPKDSRKSVTLEKDLSVDQPEVVADFQISDVKYKMCSGTYNSIQCQDTSLKTQNTTFLTQNPVIWGGSSAEIKYDIKNFGSCNQQGCGYSGRFYAIAQGTYPISEITKYIDGSSKDATGTVDLYLRPWAQADKISAEVSSHKKDIHAQIIPDPQPEITDISLCLDWVDPSGVCGTPIGKIDQNTYGPVYSGAQIGLYFKTKGIYKYGRSFGKVDVKIQVNKEGIVYENKDVISESSETPHKVWAFSAPTEVENKKLTIKVEDPADGQKTEKTIEIKIAEPPKDYQPVKHPFQYRKGSSIDYEEEGQKAELKASIDELANALNDKTLTAEERDYVKNSLFSISIITSQMPDLLSSTVIQGGTYRSDTFFDNLARAISGFTNNVGSLIGGAAGWIGEKVDEAIDWAKDTANGVIDKVSKGIDAFVNDPLGATWSAIKGTYQAVYNLGAGIGGWIMEHPWESLAIVGLAALALTGVGALAGVAGFGALGGGLGSLGSALFTAELVGTGALLTYKTSTGTLDGNDLLMGALSLGPLAAARLFKYTGLGAKLAPKVSGALGRVDNALAGGKIREIIQRFEKKMAERAAKIGDKSARGISGVQRESILTRLRGKKWSVTDDLTKLSDDELKIVNVLADDLENIKDIKKLSFVDDAKSGFMATKPDGTLIINKAVAGRDLSYFKSILNHEAGHLLHVDPATGKYFRWDKFMEGFENAKIKVPKFSGVEDDLGILEQIVADKNAFVRNPALRQEFSGWIKEVHVPNLMSKQLGEAKPELIRSIVYAKSYDPELLKIIENQFKQRWGDTMFNIHFDNNFRLIDNFVDFSNGAVIK